MSRLFIPFSWLYGGIIFLRNRWYDSRREKLFRADVAVISVGNISVGGTGKTPFSEYLVRFFVSQGLRPAYLSRGYGRASQGYRLVDPQSDEAAEYGDEALQVARKFADLPVAVCESRAEGIARLQAEHRPDLIILDDAFQHRKVLRDVDILLFDANRLPQRDYLLPAGSLREPLASLRRADFLVINKLAEPAEIEAIAARFARWAKPMAFCRPVFTGLVDFFSGEKIDIQAADRRLAAVIFSGLGNNAFFCRQLEAAGIEVLQFFSFSDHHTYSQKELTEIAAAYRKHVENSSNFDSLIILTTEKDASRLRGRPLPHFWQKLPFFYIPIRLAFWQGQEELEARLIQTINHQNT